MYKKILSFVLALMMVLSMTATALAGTFTYTSDKTVLEAGESVDVAITLDEDIEGVMALQYKLHYNNELFEMTGYEVGNVISGVECYDQTSSYVNIIWSDTNWEEQTLKAGTLVTVTFAAATSITEESDAEFTLAYEALADGIGDEINDGAVSGDPVSITVKPAKEKTPFAYVTYYNEDYEDEKATVRAAGEYSYAGGWAVVPLYVVQIPYEYADFCYMWFDEEQTYQDTYADAYGNQTYWDMENSITTDCAEIDFSKGDYFIPQFGEGYSVAPEFALTWEYDPATVPVPEYEMSPEDITFNTANTSQSTHKLENDIFQVDTPNQAFAMGYSVANMPAEYEIKDFAWKYTDPRGVEKTVTNGAVIISDLFEKDYGMGSVQLTINYWPVTHNEDEIKSCVKTAQFYYGTISTSISQTEATMQVGETLALTAEHTVEATIVWNSSDKNVATVVDGAVMAVGVGTANITATANGKTATCAVTVEAKESLTDAKIVCRNSDGEYIEVGDSFILHSQGRVGVPWKNSAYMYVMNGGEIITDVEWEIADTSLAHEDVNNDPGEGGFILNTSINRPCTTTLTATLEDGTEISCLVRIVTYAGKITYATSMATTNYKDNSKYWVAEPGETLTPAYTLSLDGNALTEEELADNTIEWRTTDENVAKFENGAYVFTEGTAEIYGVIKGYVDGEARELEGERISVYVGTQYPKNSKLVYEDGTDVPRTHVVNNYAYAVTSVEEEGTTVVNLVGIPEASTANVVVTAVSSADANSVTAQRSGNTITLSGVAKTSAPVKVNISWTKNVGDISASMATALYVNVVEKTVCDHTDITTDYDQVEGTETHTITVTCVCGETISEVTEPCADTDPVDGKCDKCKGAVACKHTNTTESTEYAVGNGTHALVTKVVCGDCGETVSTTTGEAAACSDNDQNGLCDVCNSPVGDHADMNVSNETVTAGDTVQMKISVENDQNAESVYNSYEFVVEYDSANLTYTGKECADDNCAVIAKDGKLIINGYGEIKRVSENAFVTLNFVAASVEAETTAVVKLTNAYRDTSEMAIERDIDEIKVETPEKTITIQPTTKEYKVTFSEKVTVNGEEVNEKTVKAGESVIFSVIEKDGKNASVTGATKNDDGTYTVTPTADTTVTITYTDKTYSVTVEGTGADDVTYETTATHGQEYTFTVTKASGYDYEVSANVGGKAVTLSGSYTIAAADVTGNIVINVSRTEVVVPPTPETYTVTVYQNGVKVDEKSATENQAYSYDAEDGFKVIGVTIGGAEFNGYTFTDSVLNIPAGSVNGNIEIYLGGIYNVTLPGADTEDDTDDTVTGAPEANYGTDYAFDVKDGYEPTVTINGEQADITENDDGSYTIPGDKIIGDIVITAEKIIYIESVNVYPYVKADDATVIQLVVATANDKVAEGEILQYNGANMFWSSKYNGYAYLVLVGENAELLTKEAAAAMISAKVATATEINYNGNVNMTTTDVVDVNDAQLVYDIYKAMYSNFDKVSMEKMLRADMSANAEADYGINVNDAVAVVAIVNAK